MTRRYARDEGTDERFLHRIECDAPGCSATIKPNPRISESGWVKVYQAEVWSDGLIMNAEVVADYCPEHAHIAPSNEAP